MAKQKTLFTEGREEIKKEICQACMGHRRLCGRSFCPILLKAKILLKNESRFMSREIWGSSPPSVFVGLFGYPKVFTGPLVPFTDEKDTSILDSPEEWINKTVEEILGYRLLLIKGKKRVRVFEAKEPGRVLSTIQELGMAQFPVDVQAAFSKSPRFKLVFSCRQPLTALSAPLNNVSLGENPRIPKKIDYLASDTDVKANEAIIELYRSNIQQTHITRIFSLGLLGLKKQRKLVPTEWSITAVDNALAEALRKQVLNYPEINEYFVFGHKALGNNVQLLFLPTSWMFEAMETWLMSSEAAIYRDYELGWGRKKYAENITGAYYAVKLPVLEFLSKIKRQAGVIAFLEVYKEWIPLGVWRFREISRFALRKNPSKFERIEDALTELNKRLNVPINAWLKKSSVYSFIKRQTQLKPFI